MQPPEKEKILDYNSWIAVTYPIVPLITEVCNHLRQVGFRGDPFAQLLMAKPSALTDAGLTLLGKVYSIPATLRARLDGVRGATNNLLEAPWGELPSAWWGWREQSRIDYRNFFENFNKGD